jgi:AcrR family transcriptional regulator
MTTRFTRTLYAVTSGRAPSTSSQAGRGGALDVEQIVAAAVDIALRESLDDLTLRKVARSLGRAPMSLYRHVSDVDHLRALVVEHLIAGVAVVDHGEDWRRTLTEAARGMRALLIDHPGIIDVIMRTGMSSPGMLQRVDIVMGALLRSGLPPEEVVQAHAAFTAQIFGSAVLQRSIRQAIPDSAADHRAFVTTLTGSAGGAHPHIERVAAAWGDMELDTPFEFAVQRLLDGITAQVAQATGHAGRSEVSSHRPPGHDRRP